MDTLIFLGRTLGFSLAAGVNLYATVALIGLASRFGLVAGQDVAATARGAFPRTKSKGDVGTPTHMYLAPSDIRW